MALSALNAVSEGVSQRHTIKHQWTDKGIIKRTGGMRVPSISRA